MGSMSHVPVASFGTQPYNLTVDSSDVARLIGGQTARLEDAPVNSASAYQLVGVVAVGPNKGAALIAVGSATPKAVRIGSKVDDQLYLLQVAGRTATLGAEPRGPGTVKLVMPAPALPVTTPAER